MAIAITYVYFQSLLHPADPLFLIASSNLFVNVGLMLLVAIMVRVSFLKEFRHWQMYLVTAALTIILAVVSVIGLLSTSLDYYFSSVLLQLDYLVLLQISVGLGVCVLSYKHQPVPRYFLQSKRVELAKFKQQIVTWQPKPVVQQRSGSRARTT